jgi:hypothetical protein
MIQVKNQQQQNLLPPRVVMGRILGWLLATVEGAEKLNMYEVDLIGV